MMNILFLTESFYPFIGGVEKHSLEIARKLVEIEYNVTVLSLTKNSDLKNYEEFNDIKILRIPGKKNYLKIWLFLIKNIKLLYKNDIIHCHDFSTFYWILPFFLINPKIYITYHGFEKFPIPKRNIILRKISEILTRGNICVGKYLIKYYFTKPNYIIYGGINRRNFNEKKPMIGNNSFSILFIGRLARDTGIIEYIKAMKLLKEKYSSRLKLDICGNGRLYDILKNYSKKLNLNVVFHGFIRNLKDYYKKASIVLCSSYLCIIESLYNMKPVISVYQNKLKKDYLKLSPFSEYIETTQNPRQIAEIINDIYENPEMNKQKVQMGFKFSEKNNWKSISQIYLKLWKLT